MAAAIEIDGLPVLPLPPSSPSGDGGDSQDESLASDRCALALLACDRCVQALLASDGIGYGVVIGGSGLICRRRRGER